MKTYDRKHLIAKAKEAKEHAMAAIALAREEPGYCVHREVEVSPAGADGGRREPTMYLTMKELNGKGLAKALDYLAREPDADEFAEIYISGGVDWYESFYVFANGIYISGGGACWDYTPWVESWEVKL